MPHVVLERNGLRVEADLSLNDLKDLMGIQGNNGNHQTSQVKSEQLTLAPSATKKGGIVPEPNFMAFLGDISDRGRQFVDILKSNPSGVEANRLASLLGFQSRTQIGGLTGGGLSPLAKKHGIEIGSIYRTEITKVDGARRLTFYPGNLLLNEKPAA